MSNVLLVSHVRIWPANPLHNNNLQAAKKQARILMQHLLHDKPAKPQNPNLRVAFNSLLLYLLCLLVNYLTLVTVSMEVTVSIEVMVLIEVRVLMEPQQIQLI